MYTSRVITLLATCVLVAGIAFAGSTRKLVKFAVAEPVSMDRTVTGTINPTMGGGPEAAPLSFILDDGSAEQFIGIGGGQWLWLNRFTPNAADFPLEIDSIEVGWDSGDGVDVGELFDIYIYEDTDGDGDPGTGATWLATEHASVVALDALNAYSIPPVMLNGPGDLLVAVVTRTAGIGPADYPASHDNTATQVRSWAGIYTANPVPDPPALPADALWGTIDSFGLPGNWLIRAYGEGPLTTGVPCSAITSIAARCIGGERGTIQVRVNLVNDPPHAGETVTIAVDGTHFSAAIVTNGVHTHAKFSIPGSSVGDHAISLVDPAGCLADVHAECGGSDGIAKADPYWDDDAEWLGLTQEVPQATELLGNYPNPFNPSSNIQYALSEDAHVTLRVYNMLGQVVATLVDEPQTAGYKSVVWNGRNDVGSGVASGIYIYRMTAGSFVETKRMLLLK